MSLFFAVAVMAGSVGLHIGAAFIVAAIGIFCTASAIVQFSKKIPSAGSFQTFIARSLGPEQSFWIAICLVVGYILLQAGVITIFGWWTTNWINHYVGVNIPWQIFAVLGTVGFGYLMIRGVSISTKLTVALYVIEFFIIAALGVVILAEGAPTGHGVSASPLLPGSFSSAGIKPLFLAIVFSVYCFIGFEGAASYAEETSNPRRNIPLALMSAVGIIAGLYIFSGWTTALGFRSGAEMAASTSPYLTLGQHYLGFLVIIIYICGFTSTASNIMSAGNANIRILFNCGRERFLPKFLGHVHATHRTPDYATIFFLGMCLILSLVASIWWDGLVIYALWSGLGALLCIIAYLASNLGVGVYFYRHWRSEFAILTHVILPVIAIAVWGYTLYDSLKPAPFPANVYPWGLGGVVACSIIYLLIKRRRDPEVVRNIGSIITNVDMEGAVFEEGAAEIGGEAVELGK